MRVFSKDHNRFEWLAVAIMVPIAVVLLALVLGYVGLVAMVIATIVLGSSLVRARRPFADWLQSRIGPTS
jgi:NhaP-type Na+/H+ or K+/H+ antiporter